MKSFDDRIPARQFDNFQFVNFTDMSTFSDNSVKETRFALAALMEIPIQYQATKELGLLGRVTGKAKKVTPRRPPLSSTPRPTGEASNVLMPAEDSQSQACPVCFESRKDMAFNCGHTICKDCGERVDNCPICRQLITDRIRLYI
ncbi:unnamed protein product [Cuscuta campestris]|uniref:RING-type domain-containing protein n=1 Tax=Cuscuta campestris TaxID=132261 RepID=A0A484LFG1_9ASTE|nr:unnamed protein product [Cuscuta campestris]